MNALGLQRPKHRAAVADEKPGAHTASVSSSDGCSTGSPGSFVATGTFMAVAFAVSFLIQAVT